MNAFQQSITANLTPFVVSAFEAHSLIPVTYVVSTVVAGSLRLALAKLLDLWGRPQGFAVMVTIATLGLIMMAVCQNVTTFAAAQVFYSVGFDGTIYAADVVTADSSTLRNRGLAYAITSSPYIITAFAGPKAAEGFYEKLNFRWGFGVFCIIIPVVAIPVFANLFYNQKKAQARGLLQSESSGRTIVQSIWHYTIEFDGKRSNKKISAKLIDFNT
jgi:MFS family permease